jgi:transcriptional regulator with XRE-family HTH domain
MEETMYDRMAKICKAKGITPSYMCVQLDIRKAIMSDLKSGRTATIRTDTLVKFAEYLGVTTDYLLTGHELRMTQEESALLNAWRQATHKEKENVAFTLRDYGMPMPEAHEKISEAV